MRQQSVQTLPIKTKDKGEHIRFHEEQAAAYTSTDLEMGVQVSSSPSREDRHVKTQQDKGVSLREEKGLFFVSSKGKLMRNEIMTAEVGPDFGGPTKANKSKDKEGYTCNKCGRQKRNCDSACRNTIIIPYATGSNGGIPAGDAESLRMLIKVRLT